MNNDELTQYADLIYSKLFTKGFRTKDQNLEDIKSVLISVESRGKQIGRSQIINSVQDALKSYQKM